MVAGGGADLRGGLPARLVLDVEERDINGQPSVVLSREGTVFAVLTVVASTRGIDQVLWMMNPHKLGAVSRAS